MALVKCPECKKKVSDQCGNCPHCGYPIQSNLENSATAQPVSKNTNPFYKKAWFWIVVGSVLIALVAGILGTLLLFNQETEPKLDKDGNPIFVELTNEVYTNAKKYLGYHINVKGKVFQVMSDDGNTKGIQVWIDPDTCEQNIMIYYNTDVNVKQGDYIMCSGYIDSVRKYKNAYDATLYAPVVCSTDLKKATYIDVMAPAIDTHIPEKLSREQNGYSITIDKIEYSAKETRIYITAQNNGNAALYIGDAVIIQNGQQFNSRTNYDAEYPEIPFPIMTGVSSSGIIVFPIIEANDFELSFDVHSDETNEKNDGYVFRVSKSHTHNFNSDITSPTCTAAGYTTYTCDCGASYKDNYTEATGHKWKEATCTTPKKCSVCKTTSGKTKHTYKNHACVYCYKADPDYNGLVLAASSYDVSLEYTTAVYITVAGTDTGYFHVGDESIVSCQWGTWEEGGYIPLYIIPASSGNTEIIVYVYTDGDNKSITINVSVK